LANTPVIAEKPRHSSATFFFFAFVTSAALMVGSGIGHGSILEAPPSRDQARAGFAWPFFPTPFLGARLGQQTAGEHSS
jgi:hypothetical protein